MPPKTGPTGVVEHHIHERMHRKTVVMKDEVDDLVAMHLVDASHLKANYASTRTLEMELEDAKEEKEGEEGKFEDYASFNKEQAAHHDVTNIALDIADEMRARDEIKRRASVMMEMKHPEAFKAEKKLPKFFAASYPHQATKIEIKESNEDYKYYIAHE